MSTTPRSLKDADERTKKQQTPHTQRSAVLTPSNSTPQSSRTSYRIASNLVEEGLAGSLPVKTIHRKHRHTTRHKTKPDETEEIEETIHFTIKNKNAEDEQNRRFDTQTDERIKTSQEKEYEDDNKDIIEKTPRSSRKNRNLQGHHHTPQKKNYTETSSTPRERTSRSHHAHSGSSSALSSSTTPSVKKSERIDETPFYKEMSPFSSPQRSQPQSSPLLARQMSPQAKSFYPTSTLSHQLGVPSSSILPSPSFSSSYPSSSGSMQSTEASSLRPPLSPRLRSPPRHPVIPHSSSAAAARAKTGAPMTSLHTPIQPTSSSLFEGSRKESAYHSPASEKSRHSTRDKRSARRKEEFDEERDYGKVYNPSDRTARDSLPSERNVIKEREIDADEENHSEEEEEEEEEDEEADHKRSEDSVEDEGCVAEGRLEDEEERQEDEDKSEGEDEYEDENQMRGEDEDLDEGENKGRLEDEEEEGEEEEEYAKEDAEESSASDSSLPSPLLTFKPKQTVCQCTSTPSRSPHRTTPLLSSSSPSSSSSSSSSNSMRSPSSLHSRNTPISIRTTSSPLPFGSSRSAASNSPKVAATNSPLKSSGLLGTLSPSGSPRTLRSTRTVIADPNGEDSGICVIEEIEEEEEGDGYIKHTVKKITTMHKSPQSSPISHRSSASKHLNHSSTSKPISESPLLRKKSQRMSETGAQQDKPPRSPPHQSTGILQPVSLVRSRLHKT
ncbi:uncharacterized protein MONOS_3766 [Monocercomonoides exilis]|uniref:uncharacterized protein n=1 Tax=Monocercomonoides exilis TaxID=2049356 RepID=UPI003559E6F3|nr:hypothetical protein MONOS_3766 [Monocercomonoides exilis]|eukprot:MONOS_3766.1-p1 / transcript=MONOS_3766.1 / gene=MONOS_3766 / organism=Monocercomonoides_exilis_PA203 / gene_product=unspecified product / transcript_product=unspecified product / location=Mono_scaffold00092:12401-14578(+) / protein_length=726 / sequence_SO=supercontig / SO=protein_coding / is_pseudo=false